MTWLGHSTVVLDLGGVRIVTDPLLRRDAGLLRRVSSPPDAASWQHTDAVLISHLHHDHAELASLRMLRGVPLMSDPANEAWLRRRGLEPTVALGDHWTPLGHGVEVRQVPAVHRSRPMPHRPNAANGHLVRAASGAVWIAGDTELYEEMERLPELAGGTVDLALVPVWGWGPRLSGGHLTPSTAALAVAMTRARFAIPVHWGTLHAPLVPRFGRGWLEQPGERFAEMVADRCPDATAIVLAPGQTWSDPR